MVIWAGRKEPFSFRFVCWKLEITAIVLRHLCQHPKSYNSFSQGTFGPPSDDNDSGQLCIMAAAIQVAPIAQLAQLLRTSSQMQKVRGSNPRLGGLRVNPLSPAKRRGWPRARLPAATRLRSPRPLDFRTFLVVLPLATLHEKSIPSLWRDKHPAINGIQTNIDSSDIDVDMNMLLLQALPHFAIVS